MGFLALVLQPIHDIIQGILTLILIIFVATPAICIGFLKEGTRVTKTHRIFCALREWPGGNYMFLKIVAFIAPYSGTIGGKIDYLEPGVCKMMLHDRPWLGNPFASIHAIALVNFAELTSGLAVMTAIETVKGAMGIPVKISIVYHAKARGTISCRAALPELIPSVPGIYPMDIKCELYNESGVIVATAIVSWSFKVREPKKQK